MDNIENRDTIDWLKPENRFRATPMDLFKQGLRTQNWEAVSAAYLMFTGEKIEVGRHEAVPTEKEQTEPPKPKRKRGRPRKNLLPETPPVATLPTPVKAEDATPASIDPLYSDCVAPAKAPGSAEKIFTKSRQHDCRPHPNEFNDDGTEAPDEIVKERNVPAAILNAKRPPVKNVRVRCQQCGKVEDIDPSLVPYGLRLTKDYTMRYICNSCVVGARSGIELEALAEEPLFEGEE